MEYLVSMIVWILAVYGMSTIIVNSQLFQPVRNFLVYSKLEVDEKGYYSNVVERRFKLLGKLINCVLCTSFWVGVFWSTLYWHPFSETGAHWILHALFGGCLGAATTWLIYLNVHPLMHNK